MSVLYFRYKECTIHVPFHKILFETFSTVHTSYTEEQIEFYGQLSKVVKQDCRLYKCYKSFVVNPENIVEIGQRIRCYLF